MNPTTARVAKALGHVGVAAVAQLVLATATASAAPTMAPCTTPATPERRPAQHEPVHPNRPHLDAPVRAGDLCMVEGATATAEPGGRAVTCGRWRGLKHLTWG